MFETNSYFFIVLNLSGGLLSLLGAVGIFVTLIIQRRVEKLQDILEELLDISLADDKNTTGKIQRLILKYQMHYTLPVQPVSTVLAYIRLTIFFVFLFWAWLLALTFRSPFQWQSLFYLFPMAAVLCVMIFYGQLVKNAVNPVDNSLFNSLLPEPRQLRSIAFLSVQASASGGKIITQARPLPVLRKKGTDSWWVILKEEIPLDDYHYYFSLYHPAHSGGKKVFFVGHGHILIELLPNPLTGRNRSTARNINIPLGEVVIPKSLSVLNADFVVFPRGETNPLTFHFHLERESNVFYTKKSGPVSFNHNLSYGVDPSGTLMIKEIRDENVFHHLPVEIASGGIRRYSCPDGNPRSADGLPYED